MAIHEQNGNKIETTQKKMSATHQAQLKRLMQQKIASKEAQLREQLPARHQKFISELAVALVNGNHDEVSRIHKEMDKADHDFNNQFNEVVSIEELVHRANSGGIQILSGPTEMAGKPFPIINDDQSFQQFRNDLMKIDPSLSLEAKPMQESNDKLEQQPQTVQPMFMEELPVPPEPVVETTSPAFQSQPLVEQHQVSSEGSIMKLASKITEHHTTAFSNTKEMVNKLFPNAPSIDEMANAVKLNWFDKLMISIEVKTGFGF